MLDEDCYRLLQVPPDVDEKTIRRAYRERSKELHPDVNPSPDAAAQFARLALAVETLLDPVQRLKHDDRFGYSKKVRSQEEHAKQTFSEFQKEKAEHLVKEWSSDYDKAMEMRERQRLQVIKNNRRRMLISIIIFILLALLLAMSIFIVGNDIPDQK